MLHVLQSRKIRRAQSGGLTIARLRVFSRADMPRGKKGDAQVKARAEEKRVKADFLSQRRTVCLVRTKEGKTARGTGVAVTYRGLTCVLTTYAALPDRAACDACVCVFDFEASLDARLEVRLRDVLARPDRRRAHARARPRVERRERDERDLSLIHI